jgi:hypothetical protein
MRKKWYDSDNATLQMGLMKLIATPEEHKRLATNFNDHTTNGESIKQTIMQVEIVKPSEEDEE